MNVQYNNLVVDFQIFHIFCDEENHLAVFPYTFLILLNNTAL